MKEAEIQKPSQMWTFLPDSVICVLDELTQPKTYKKGSYLYMAEERPKGLFFVYHGLVGLSRTSEDGKEHLFRIFGKGLCLGHRALVGEEPYHASAKVLEDSMIGFVEADAVYKLLHENSEFARQMLKKLAKELRMAELRLAGSTNKQVSERVAEALIYLVADFPQHRWTRNEIADYCGTTAPTVIRTLAQFEDQGFIAQQGREIRILNRRALEDFAHLT